MNREILFRGKRMDNGEWVYGDYHKFTCTTSGITPTPTHYIIGADVNFKGQTWVDPDTIGQYTGLTDKNGVKIFEGDIVKVPYRRDAGIVKFELPECQYVYDMQGDGDFIEMGEWGSEVEVIGNIHNNPELLEADNEAVR